MDRRRIGTTAALCALVLLLLLLGGIAEAGGTKADYARAATMGKRVRGTVRNLDLDVQWLEDDSLAYQRQNPDGSKQLVLVDLATGTKRDAPADSDLARAGSAPLEPSGARRTKNDGPETEIQIVNRHTEAVELIWLDRDGVPQSYGEIPAGASRRQHTFTGHVWLIRTKTGGDLGTYTARRTPGVIVVTGEPAEVPKKPRSPSAAVSPDGRYRAFLRGHDVYLQDKERDAEVRLTTDGTAEDRYVGRWRWSPSGRYLMVVQEVPAQKRRVHVVNSVPEGGFQPELIHYDYLKPGDRIAKPRPRILDVEKQEAIPFPEDLYDSPWSINHFSWSADEERLSFLYNQRGHQALRLVELDPSTGKARALIDERSDTFVDYSQKTLLRPIEDGRAWLWMSERSGWNHLYRVDATTGEATPVTQGEWLIRRVLHVDEDTQQVRFAAMGVHPDQDPYHVHVGRIGFDGKGLIWLTHGDGTHTVDFAPDGRHYVDTWSRVDLPPVHELRRTTNGERVCELERADASKLLETGWKTPERLHAAGRDGKTEIWGVLYLPSTFDASKHYPVVESIYAGPHGHFVPKRFRLWSDAQALAELGFVVVQIDGMGTNWRSRAFHDVCWKNLGDSGFPDRIAWLRAAKRVHPYLDLDRVGIYGGSAGGQSALRALLAHDDFYDVAVADCGCHDNRMDKIWWNEAWMGWPIGPHYEEQSNVTQAHRMRGKLLLIVGEVDRNVDPASTLKVVDALIKADKDFDLLVIPGQGHGAAGTKYGRRRLQDFLVRHLQGVEPRAR